MGSHICRHLLKGFHQHGNKGVASHSTCGLFGSTWKFCTKEQQKNERNNREHEIEKRSPAGHTFEEEDKTIGRMRGTTEKMKGTTGKMRGIIVKMRRIIERMSPSENE